jgi:hypothetical protein
MAQTRADKREHDRERRLGRLMAEVVAGLRELRVTLTFTLPKEPFKANLQLQDMEGPDGVSRSD